MKIEINRAYFVPTQELEDDFLKRAEEQGFLWGGGGKPTEFRYHLSKQSGLCICVEKDKRIYFASMSFALSWSDTEIVEWEIEKSNPVDRFKKEEKAANSKFKVGDIVTGNSGNPYVITTANMKKGKVTRVLNDEERINVVVIEHENPHNVGLEFIVDPQYFDLIEQREHPYKPTIIRLGNLKIVFNGDYTIVTDGRFTGKARRNPADEYDAVVGLKLAVERYEKDKQEKDILVNFVAQYYLEQMLSKCIKPIRFAKSEEKEK